MRKIENFENVIEAGESLKLPVGPQYAKITKITDVPEKNYLAIEFDLVKGEFAGCMTNMFKSMQKWPALGKINRSYSDNSLPFFKAFITAIEKSNEGYNWNWNEQSLVGKYCVVNFGEEEYVSDGKVLVSVKAREIRSIPSMKAGDVKPLERKVLSDKEKESLNAQLEPQKDILVLDDDLPF